MTDRSRDSLIRMKDVKRRTGLSAATIYRRMSAGTFPRNINLGGKLVAWYETDLDAWVADPAAWTAAA